MAIEPVSRTAPGAPSPAPRVPPRAAEPAGAPSLARPDRLVKRENLGIPSSADRDYKAIFAWVEKAIDKPVAYQTDAQIATYLRAMTGEKPERYDPRDFLASLGLRTHDLETFARYEKRPEVVALTKMLDYRPETRFLGMKIPPQQWAFNLLQRSPEKFARLENFANPIMEWDAKRKKLWDKPILDLPVVRGNKPDPIVKIQYGKTEPAIKMARREPLGPIQVLFERDFHVGVPPKGAKVPQNYGTFHLARLLGFSEEQAKRIGIANFNTDENKTRYGRTGPAPFFGLDRHFNLNRDNNAQDTRLLWAERHLDLAVALARTGKLVEAETELGIGLHSLQDAFAHGQWSPSMHATVGHLPDEVTLDPLAVAEASLATSAYLRTYLVRVLAEEHGPIG